MCKLFETIYLEIAPDEKFSAIFFVLFCPIQLCEYRKILENLICFLFGILLYSLELNFERW
jgi:hypothetical protein